MNTLEIIGAFLGIPLAILGVAGGLLNIEEKVKKWKRERLKHGDRGVEYFVLSKSVVDGLSEYHILVAGDLWHILQPLIRDTKGTVTQLNMVGEYYEVKVRCVPGFNSIFQKVDKTQ
ncbi:hypothetical protein [Gimesia maris]|uniref:Phage protein n=1 Tax=Gimesia maris TaxID=122 RepID=A0ABX5YPE2_9PLAN|nr:hypothetical protein [Gimesia maris]EDL58367.1 hypothetical protein PM8797T_26965 [Gimesia maris DSM 8797]QEG17538.1 hypothetical protein GmarT_34200 [Gimesia maris]QGQ29398.1 hypothetical protein F1729_12420 [Gimesia maris]